MHLRWKIVVGVTVVATAVAAVAVAVVLRRGTTAELGPTEAGMARQLGSQVMLSIDRGHVPGRSGDIFLVPKPNNFVATGQDVCGVAGAPPAKNTAHPMPWAYLARIPYVFYGPGYAPAGKTVYSPTDVSSLSPTYAKLMRFGAFHAQGTALPQIHPGKRPPKLIVTVVLDGGGWNTLDYHPGAWPNIERLIRDGTSYANATNASAPSITGAIHATMGTGDYPRVAGIPGNQMRGPDGKIVDTYLHRADPRYLRAPTISDLWDRSNGNRPVVGALAYEGWHLGFLGHGAALAGGDKDVAALWDPKRTTWWTNTHAYTLPSYLAKPDLASLRRYEAALDGRDGVPDGYWFGHTRESLQDPSEQAATPAFARFTGDAALRILKSEPFGRDSLTDLLWVEIKAPDEAGHMWNVTSSEEGDVIRASDDQVGRIRAALDRRVGRGNYVLAVTADHGQQPLPELTGGWRIDARELRSDIQDRFGPVVQKVTATEIFLDHAALQRHRVNPDEIARFLGAYTVGDNTPQRRAGRVAPDRLSQPVFAGAFTSSFLESLTEPEIAAFGQSSYVEGALTSATQPTG
jgi:Type I phosphodiesterase / nucleotide pyrophosphatase